MALLEAGLSGPGHGPALPVTTVQDAADLATVAVGEHGAPQHRPQHLEVLLAVAGVYNNVTLPQNIAEQVTVLRGEVITGARTLAQTLSEVRVRTSNEGVTGVQVAVGKEVAGETFFVKAPELTVILDPAQLLADAGRLLVAGQWYGHNDLIRVRVALRHGEEGALGPGQGQQGEEAQER